MVSLVRYGASEDGGVHANAVGGRGAWICRNGDEAHDRQIGDGLRRGLKGRVTGEDLDRILKERIDEKLKGGSR